MTHEGFGEAKPLGSAEPALSPATPSGPTLPPPPAVTGPATMPDHDVFAGPTAYKEIPLPPRPDSPEGYFPTVPFTGTTAAVPASTSRNWMGITSLALGVIGGSVAGLAFGILGIRAANRGKATNRGLAIAGIVLNSVVLVLTVVIAGVAIVAGGLSESSASSNVPASPRYVDINDVAVGDCVMEPDLDGDGIDGFSVVDCKVPHWGQVYYIGELPPGDYPGDEAVWTAAEDGCFSDEGLEAVSYFIPDDAYGFTIWPDVTSWEWGDRTYDCLLVNDEEPLTKSYVD